MNNAEIYKARQARLHQGLRILGGWAISRADVEYDDDTTMTMLVRKVQELMVAVDKAGWAASNKQPVNTTSTTP